MDHILYHTFKIILSILSKKKKKKKKTHEKLGDNPPIKTCVNKIENTITFKTKEKNCLQILTPETMKILGSSKIKIDKYKSGESVPHLEIAEVVLVHCNVVSNDYQTDSRFLYEFVTNKSFGQLLNVLPKNLIF